MLISSSGNLSGLVSGAAPVKTRIFRDPSGIPSRWRTVFDRTSVRAMAEKALCRR